MSLGYISLCPGLEAVGAILTAPASVAQCNPSGIARHDFGPSMASFGRVQQFCTSKHGIFLQCFGTFQFFMLPKLLALQDLHRCSRIALASILLDTPLHISNKGISNSRQLDSEVLLLKLRACSMKHKSNKNEGQLGCETAWSNLLLRYGFSLGAFYMDYIEATLCWYRGQLCHEAVAVCCCVIL